MNANKLIFLLLLCKVAYGQTFPNTVTVQKDLRVQQETILGGVNKPVAGDMYIFYDSIYAPNIFGTGNFLTLNGAGYLELNTAAGGGAGTVTSVATTTPITGGTITSTGTIGIGGLSTFGTAGQLIRTNAGGTGWEYFTPTYGTGTVTSIATTSPIGGGTITSTGTLNLLASGADKYLYSTGVNTWAEGAISTYSRGLLDEVDNLGWYSTLDISANTNEILFGGGTNILSSGNLTFDGTIFALGNGIDFHMARFEVGNLGVIEKYSNSTATDGTFFIGNSGSGAWETGTITSSDITVGYSNPNITLSISGLDATKINTGDVSNTEFNYLNGVTSDIQTQLDARSKVVATSHLTSRNAAIAATTLYAVPADGFYTITVQLAVTTTGGTSIGTQIRFTNVADNVVKTLPSNNSNGLNQCASTTTANAVCYTITAYCKSGTNIQYITNLAGSGQVYSLDAQVVKD